MLTKGKFRSLDAICAKLKSVNENEAEDSNNLSSTLVNGGSSDTSNNPENNNKFNKTILDSCISCEEVKDEGVVELTNISRNGSSVLSSQNRRKRKATTPRNILEVREKFDKIDEKDELADYEINNQNTNFPPEDEDELNSSNNSSTSGKENRDVRLTSGDDKTSPADEKTSPADDRSKSETKTGNDHSEAEKKPENGPVEERDISSRNDSPVSSSIHASLQPSDRKQTRKPRKSVPSFGGCGSPLDLSTSTPKTSNRSSINDKCDSEIAEDEDENEGSEASNVGEDVKDKAEISSLMDYAEHTMNELLSIYGLNGAGESVARVPVQQGQGHTGLQQGQGHTGLVSSGKGAVSTSVIVPRSNSSLTHVPSEKKGINVNYLSSTSKVKGQSSDGKLRFYFLIERIKQEIMFIQLINNSKHSVPNRAAQRSRSIIFTYN